MSDNNNDNNNVEITLRGGTKVRINLARALELGLVSPARKLITKVYHGDVFYYPDFKFRTVMVIKPSLSDRYYLTGIYESHFCLEEIVDYLNQRNMVFAENINIEISKLIEQAEARARERVKNKIIG